MRHSIRRVASGILFALGLALLLATAMLVAKDARAEWSLTDQRLVFDALVSGCKDEPQAWIGKCIDGAQRGYPLMMTGIASSKHQNPRAFNRSLLLCLDGIKAFYPPKAPWEKPFELFKCVGAVYQDQARSLNLMEESERKSK